MFDDRGIQDHLRELSESLRDWMRYKSISLEELHIERDKRDILVHVYLGVDTEAVYEVLQRDLNILREFEKVVKGLLQGREIGWKSW